MTQRVPGGVPSAQPDGFVRSLLPPSELWPIIDYSGVPELVAYPDRFNAAVELLDKAVTGGHGARPVIHFKDAVWSYRRLLDNADRIARVLTEDFGLVPGHRVLLRGANTPGMVACWFAVLKAGGVCVATMPLLRARELTYILNKAQVGIALCDLTLAEELNNARPRAAALRHVAHFSALLDGAVGDSDLDHRMSGKAAGFANVPTAADDPALIAFTSGTTGDPKGTVHFHRDVLACTDCFPRYTAKVSPDDVFCGSPPLAFTFGLGAQTLFPMRFGASTALIPAPSPEAICETVQRYRCTTLYTAPTLFRVLAGMTGTYDLSSLKKSVSAGETLPKATWEAWHQATGIRIVDGLGSTEMIHIFVSATPEEMRAGFTGKAIPGYQARVVDEEGNTLPPGSQGLLAVIGPTGCRYLDNLERQRAYVRKGWNYTGDVYEWDKDGYLRYVARSDDMIISAGYNISGPEIEGVLLEHPAVAECAVIGAPDAERGQIVKAFVVLREAAQAGPSMAKTLQDHVKASIAPYKYPRAVQFVDSLPKTQTGKLQRFRLRDTEKT